MGVSEALGVPPAMAAGAIVSGAFFGDKISPMSDSTNLTSSFLGVDLYEHIKHMLYSTIPVLGISLIVFTIMGFNLTGNENSGDVSGYSDGIRANFSISLWLLIPPAVVIFLIVRKVPAIPSLLTGLLLGCLTNIILQGGSPAELLKTIQSGYVLNTGDQKLDNLFSRGGLESMYNVVALALISLAFGGIMDKSGMLHSLVIKIAPFIYKKIGNLTLAVLGSSIFINIFSANQYLAVILPGQMFEECYRDRRLKLKNLTRTLEAGGTLTAPLVPWNSSAVFVAAAIGISATAYAPYAVFCWLTPIVNVIFAYARISMTKLAAIEVKEKDADE
jgi:NhaC family Na+:H+ antiporter